MSTQMRSAAIRKLPLTGTGRSGQPPAAASPPLLAAAASAAAAPSIPDAGPSSADGSIQHAGQSAKSDPAANTCCPQPGCHVRCDWKISTRQQARHQQSACQKQSQTPVLSELPNRRGAGAGTTWTTGTTGGVGACTGRERTAARAVRSSAACAPLSSQAIGPAAAACGSVSARPATAALVRTSAPTGRQGFTAGSNRPGTAQRWTRR